jgi:GTP:adenosylcobinamide-phosphate guanylyltransferase
MSIFAGDRCNELEPARDQYGGYMNRECRDISPGSSHLSLNIDLFHLVNVNVIGNMGESYVLDVDATAEVWNQPALSYKLLDIVNLLN